MFQKRHSIIFVCIVLLFAGLLNPISTVRAAPGHAILYLGRIDDTGDGQTDSKDRLHLFAVLDGNQQETLSKDTESVAAFGVSPDLANVAYAATDTAAPDKTLKLQILNLDSRQAVTVPLASFKTVEEVRFFSTAVWLIGRDKNNKPHLEGFATQDGKLVGQRSMRLDNSQITLQGQGGYAFAFSKSGAFGIFQLPKVEPVDVTLEGYAGTEPRFSPTTPKVQLVVSPQNNKADRGLAIVDLSVNPPTVKRIDLPDYGSKTKLRATWSRTGKYVVYSGTDYNDKATVVGAHNTLINVETGATTSLEFQGKPLEILSWSSDDALAVCYFPLGAASLDSTNSPNTLVIFNPVDNSYVPIKGPGTVQYLSLAWSPVSNTLGMLGGSQQLQQYGVFLLEDLKSGEPRSLFATNEAQLQRSQLFWESDGNELVLASGAATLKDNNTGKVFPDPGGVFTVSVSDGTVTRVSGQDVFIDTTGLFAR